MKASRDPAVYVLCMCISATIVHSYRYKIDDDNDDDYNNDYNNNLLHILYKYVYTFITLMEIKEILYQT